MDELADTEVGEFSTPYIPPPPPAGQSKRTRLILLLLLLLFFFTCFASAAILAVYHFLFPSTPFSSSDDDGGAPSSATSMIFMIADGFGPASQTFAREISGSQQLSLDPFLRGTLRTFSASSVVTDSAAGATAYSCALHTFNRGVGVDAGGAACGTVLEAAQRKGMRTGVVVRSTVSHATPAAFSAHSVERDWEEFIALQQFELGLDVLMGGGRDQWERRRDGRNLTAEAAARGYHVVYDKAALLAPTLALPVLALLAPSHMEWAIDSAGAQPRLVDMTRVALALLARAPRGFFLLVEGSRIDMAAHANDPGAHYAEIAEYMDAAALVVRHAAENPRTHVYSVADHETGGLALGINQDGVAYPQYVWYPERVAQQACSAEKIAASVVAGGALRDALEGCVPGLDAGAIPPRFWERMNGSVGGGVHALGISIGSALSYYGGVGWSTLGHTGVDVNMYAVNSLLPSGNYENVQLGKYVMEVLQLGKEVEEVTKKLRNFNASNPGVATNTLQHDDVYHPFH